MIIKKTTHEAEGVAHLIEQFRGKPKLGAFITLLMTQVQELEDAFFQIVTDTVLAVAIGEQLDGIGRIVDEPRNALDDTDYRLLLTVKFRVIRSTGTIEDLIAILDELTGGGMTIELSQSAVDIAHFDILISTALPAGVDGVVVSNMTLRAKGAGIRGIITFFDSDGIAFDTVGEGFDDADDAFGTSVGD